MCGPIAEDSRESQSEGHQSYDPYASRDTRPIDEVIAGAQNSQYTALEVISRLQNHDSEAGDRAREVNNILEDYDGEFDQEELNAAVVAAGGAKTIVQSVSAKVFGPGRTDKTDSFFNLVSELVEAGLDPAHVRQEGELVPA